MPPLFKYFMGHSIKGQKPRHYKTRPVHDPERIAI
jgi:hypothetical protein